MGDCSGAVSEELHSKRLEQRLAEGAPLDLRAVSLAQHQKLHAGRPCFKGKKEDI